MTNLMSNKHDIVDSTIEWLEHLDCNRHGPDSKPTRAILLCPWERHFTALFLAWYSWQAVLSFTHISMN